MSLLDNVRMSQAWLLEQYNNYLKERNARQITFDQFCDEYDKLRDLN